MTDGITLFSEEVSNVLQAVDDDFNNLKYMLMLSPFETIERLPQNPHNDISGSSLKI